MKLSTKATLYSALVFPGVGYFLLKKKMHGVISITVTLAGLVIIFIDSFHKAEMIAEKIVSGAIPMDMLIIREQLLQTPGTFSASIINLVMFVIIAVWLVGVVDSYRLGRMEDKKK